MRTQKVVFFKRSGFIAVALFWYCCSYNKR